MRRTSGRGDITPAWRWPVASVFEVPDEVWEEVEPLCPRSRPRPTGRPRVADRAAFDAIVFVLVTGTAWRHVPPELGCSGVTA